MRGAKTLSMNTHASDQLMTVEQLAEKLQIPKTTLYAWRYRGTGPLGIAVGRHLRYRRADVERWLDAESRPRAS